MRVRARGTVDRRVEWTSARDVGRTAIFFTGPLIFARWCERAPWRVRFICLEPSPSQIRRAVWLAGCTTFNRHSRIKTFPLTPTHPFAPSRRAEAQYRGMLDRGSARWIPLSSKPSASCTNALVSAA